LTSHKNNKKKLNKKLRLGTLDKEDKKKIKTSFVNPVAKGTFREQLDYVELIEAEEENNDDKLTHGWQYRIICQKFGKDWYDANFKGKKTLWKSVKMTLRRISKDRSLIKCMCAVGLGETNQTARHVTASKNLHEKLNVALSDLLKNEIKLSPTIINACAIKLAVELGYHVLWDNKTCGGTILTLMQDDEKAQTRSDDDNQEQYTVMYSNIVKDVMSMMKKSQEQPKLKNGKSNVFKPTKSWRTQFMARYNYTFSSNSKKSINKFRLLSQLESSLEIVYCLRYILGVKAGEGLIRNCDEKMFYIQGGSTRSWFKKKT